MSGARQLVAITRPAEQAAPLAALLQARGIDTLIAPAIRRLPPVSWAALDKGIELLGQGRYAGVLFTSPAGVAAFAERRRGALPRDLVIGAVGTGTAAALEAIALHAAVVPPEGHGLGLAAALIDRLGPRLRGLRFLQPRAADGRAELSRELAAAGAAVDVVDAYRTLLAGPEDLSPLQRALAQGRVDAVVYASPSAVRAVLEALGTLGDAAAVAIGGTTAVALQAAGAVRLFVADQPDDESLLAATLQALAPAPS